jgi:hypothetical protein
MERRTTKARIDRLFVAHTGVATIAGLMALLLPHVWEWFMISHGETLSLRDNASGEQKVTHLVIRLYGALILGQVRAEACARASPLSVEEE